MNAIQRIRNRIIMTFNRDLIDDYDHRCGYCRCYYTDSDTFCRYCGKKIGGGSFKPYIDDRYATNGREPMRRSHECLVCKKTWHNEGMHDYDVYCVDCGAKLITREYSNLRHTDMALTDLPALHTSRDYYLNDRSIWSPFALYTTDSNYQFRVLNGLHVLGRNNETHEFFGRKALYIARRQVYLDSRDDRLYVKLYAPHSLNRVNDIMVGTDWMEIKDGDKLTLGQLTFTVSYEGYPD